VRETGPGVALGSGTAGRAVVLAGRGRYEDPWHDHAATSHEIALTLAEIGLDVEIRGAFPRALDDLAGVGLLVVNTGSARPAPDDEIDGSTAAWGPAHEALDAYARGGGAVLGVHQAASSFADEPGWASAWAEILGGRWVPGRSMHPERGPGTFDVLDAAHPAMAGLAGDTVLARAGLASSASFVVDDERYSYLEVAPTARVLVTQRFEGVDHPVVWVNEAHGGRTVYDALGHDVASYRDPVRRALLQGEVRWLLG
jgi:hypothetical protein